MPKREEEVSSRLTGLGSEILAEIKKHEVPKMMVPQRSLNNVTFNEKSNLLTS